MSMEQATKECPECGQMNPESRHKCKCGYRFLKECYNCGLFSLEEAVQCSCGYRFSSRTLSQPLRSSVSSGVQVIPQEATLLPIVALRILAWLHLGAGIVAAFIIWVIGLGIVQVVLLPSLIALVVSAGFCAFYLVVALIAENVIAIRERTEVQ